LKATLWSYRVKVSSLTSSLLDFFHFMFVVFCFLVCEWGMVDIMHNVVLVVTKHVVQKARFIFFSYDEVTTLDNQS
jgi:hypothetical protein